MPAAAANNSSSDSSDAEDTNSKPLKELMGFGNAQPKSDRFKKYRRRLQRIWQTASDLPRPIKLDRPWTNFSSKIRSKLVDAGMALVTKKQWSIDRSVVKRIFMDHCKNKRCLKAVREANKIKKSNGEQVKAGRPRKSVTEVNGLNTTSTSSVTLVQSQPRHQSIAQPAYNPLAPVPASASSQSSRIENNPASAGLSTPPASPIVSSVYPVSSVSGQPASAVARATPLIRSSYDQNLLPQTEYPRNSNPSHGERLPLHTNLQLLKHHFIYLVLMLWTLSTLQPLRLHLLRSNYIIIRRTGTIVSPRNVMLLQMVCKLKLNFRRMHQMKCKLTVPFHRSSYLKIVMRHQLSFHSTTITLLMAVILSILNISWKRQRLTDLLHMLSLHNNDNPSHSA